MLNVPMESQRGQVAVSILLAMVVLMTVGLSVATRTTQELMLSQQEAESTRVFHGAESGVEEALTQDFTTITDPLNPVTGSVSDIADVDIDYEIAASTSLYTSLLPGEVATVKLKEITDAGSAGTLSIDWGQYDVCDSSLIVTVYRQDVAGDATSEYVTRHYPLNQTSPGCTNSPSGNNFQDISASGLYNLDTRYTLNYDAEDLMVRIMPVYAQTVVSVTGSSLPQQHVISSTGTNTLNDGAENQEERSLQVTRTLSGAPNFMDFAAYSGGNLSK